MHPIKGVRNAIREATAVTVDLILKPVIAIYDARRTPKVPLADAPPVVGDPDPSMSVMADLEKMAKDPNFPELQDSTRQILRPQRGTLQKYSRSDPRYHPSVASDYAAAVDLADPMVALAWEGQEHMLAGPHPVVVDVAPMIDDASRQKIVGKEHGLKDVKVKVKYGSIKNKRLHRLKKFTRRAYR